MINLGPVGGGASLGHLTAPKCLHIREIKFKIEISAVLSDKKKDRIAMLFFFKIFLNSGDISPVSLAESLVTRSNLVIITML